MRETDSTVVPQDELCQELALLGAFRARKSSEAPQDAGVLLLGGSGQVSKATERG